MRAKMRIAAWLAVAVVASGCSPEAPKPLAGQTIETVVTTLVQRAQAGDSNYFVAFLDSGKLEDAAQIMTMVQRSGMATNYLGRLRKDSAGQARLDYHDPDAECHFQVDLQQAGADWRVRRFYFCR